MRIGINGLGRIGRCILRAVFEENIKNIEISAINGPADINTHIHLIKYDSVHGRFNADIKAIDDNTLSINNKIIPLFKEKNPANIPWGKHETDVVMECTGVFTSKEQASIHLNSGAKKVIISAPAKEKDVPTIIYQVNDGILTKDMSVISIGSCTTNCLAPIAKILNKEFGIEKGFMTTVHAYTNDQNNLDASHSDLRRARACALSMIPASTGAAKAIGLVLPELNNKLDGVAIRVPTPNVSMIDFCFLSKRNVTIEEINNAVSSYANSSMKTVLAYDSNYLVSIDYNHTTHSSIFDSTGTRVVDGNFARVSAWYDNEWAFSIRMIDVALSWMKKI